MAEDEGLVKIYVDVPGDDFPVSESLWAEPVGDDLYAIRNTPWYAFDLHFLDVVRAVPEHPGELPRIREVVRPSGHKTLRVFFFDKASDEFLRSVLDDLNARAANYEHAHGRLYGIDVRPEADYLAVCDYLWRLQQDGYLAYETGSTDPATGSDPIY